MPPPTMTIALAESVARQQIAPMPCWRINHLANSKNRYSSLIMKHLAGIIVQVARAYSLLLMWSEILGSEPYYSPPGESVVTSALMQSCPIYCSLTIMILRDQFLLKMHFRFQRQLYRSMLGTLACGGSVTLPFGMNRRNAGFE